jgi:hypothetical protein
VADEHEAIEGQVVGKVENVLGESRRLPTHRIRAFDASRAKPAEVRYQEAQVFALQLVNYAIPGANSIRETVKQDDRKVLGGTVLFVFDLDQVARQDRSSVYFGLRPGVGRRP